MGTQLQAQTKAPQTRSGTPVRMGLLQRKCACGSTLGPTREREECSKKWLQRKIRNSEFGARTDFFAPNVVHEVLRSPGEPLDAETRAFMEPRFGHDFSQARVHSAAPPGTLQRTPDDQAPSPKKEEGTETETAAAAEIKPAPPCDPKGLLRADYLKEPGTSTDDFGLTQLSGTVSVPVVHTSKTPRGLVLDPTGAQLPPLTSVFTAADTFIEGTVIFFGESTECPSGRKYPQQWRILLGGAQKIREAELEHCADFQYAFANSLQRYADVVNDLAAKKKTFPTQKAAEQYVTRIVGPAPNTWTDVFKCLAKKTKIRDDSKWHTPRPLTKPPRLEDDCKFARAYVTGLTEVGKHPSAEIIKDCGEGPPTKAKVTAVPPGAKTQSAPASKVAGKAELRRKPAAAAPPVVHEVLSQPGQPLDANTRAFMEPRFGHDFSGVRVHTDARAAESAGAVNALAYTVGRDVVFGAGQYAPVTTDGQRLLAHELAHTIQQLQGPVEGMPMATAMPVNEINDVYEQEANRVASELASSAIAHVHLRHSSAIIQRQTGIALKETKSFSHSDLKSDEDKKKFRTNIGAVTLMQVTPAGDYSAGQKRGDCVKEFLTEVSNTCPAHEFCTGNKCLEVNRFGTSGDPQTGITVTDGPDTFIDRHVTRMGDSFLEGSGKDKCSVVCHQRYKYRTEPDKNYTDLGSFYIIRNFKAGRFTPAGSKDALHITTGEVKKVTASLEAPSKEKFAKDIAPGLVKSGALLEAPPVPKGEKK